VTDIDQQIAYFDSTFEEAMTLTLEARDYLAHQKQADFSELGAASRLVASCESMRLTARVTQVVAWLMVQKAVHAGEITRQQAAAPEYRLAGHLVCEEGQPVLDEPLPERLAMLLDSSLRLYQRVVRLDAMLDREQHTLGPASII
jgi:regulator of CtrA degradation